MINPYHLLLWNLLSRYIYGLGMLVTIIILAVFGIIMIAMEVILPGAIFGIGGAIVLCISLLLVATSPDLAEYGASGRFMLAGGIVAFAVVSLVLWLKYFTKAGFVKKHLLSSEIDGTQSYDRYTELLKKTGTTETDLRPVGKARIAGEKHDVRAERGTIERGTDVVVVAVEGSKITVRATT